MAGEALARERLVALRETIDRMEGKTAHRFFETPGARILATGRADAEEGVSGPLPLAVPPLDAVLDGGLPRAGMAEIRAAELRNAGAATGLALSLCAFLTGKEAEAGRHAVLWVGERAVAREAGEPFAPGLADHGISLERLIYAAPRKLEEALWLTEAALTSRAFRAVILEIAGNPKRFGLSESRRLSLRARHNGSLLLLLRQGGGEEAGSTLFRIEAAPASSGSYRLADGRPLTGTIGAPGFSLTIEKSPRAPSSLLSQAMTIEWNAHDRLFLEPRLPALSANDRPAHPGARLPLSADGPDRAEEMGAVVAFSRAS
jgi:protein ImuA